MIGEPAGYPLAADTIRTDEIEAAKAVLDSGRLTMGAQVRAFEAEFAEWVGSGHAIMVNSGSSANLLIADSLLRRGTASPRLAPGDEVLVPGLAWPTTVWPLAQLGLVPVFVDVDPETLAIDLEAATGAVSGRTKGMFLIHALGRAVDLDAYAAFCRERGIELLEDCCESLGAHSGGRHVGSAGAAASFSFYFSHHISTIEGGMVVTDDQALADDLRSLRAHGWIRDRSDRAEWVAGHPTLDPRFLFATVGYNVRPMELQAAIGRVQLRRLDEMLAARERLAQRVHGLLQRHAPWIELIGASTLESRPSARRDRRHSWMTLPLRVAASGRASRDEVVRHLEAHGVETRPIIAGNLARHPGAAQVTCRIGSPLAVCDALLRDTLMIGCHPVLAPGSLETLEAAIVSLGSI